MRSRLSIPDLAGTLVLLLTIVLFATVLPASAVGAQGLPQHELLIAVDFDGTPSFSSSDVFDDGQGAHTPGLDLSANNNVVRTNDQIQYALNWNVNEADATNVTIRVTLPDKVTWLPDASTVTGVPGGCTDDGSSSITGNGGRDLVCVIAGSQIQGSNGAIHPKALVGGLLDNDLVAVGGTIESTENTTPADSNTMTTTVSATPRADWIKGKALKDVVSGAIISYEPDEVFYGVFDPSAGETGRIFIWNLRMVPTGGLKGAEPINDAVPIQFWDHWFDTVPSAKLVDPALMPTNNAGAQRVNCGGYDGDGSYPYGQTAGVASTTPANQTNIGLWNCTDLGTGVNGYPLIQIDVTSQDTQNIATQNVDLSPNDEVLASGQIAFWASEADLIGKTGVPQITQNAITGTMNVVPLGSTEVDPIQVAGASGMVDEYTGDSPSAVGGGLSNNAPYEFPTSPPSEPGRSFRHGVVYLNGPYAELQYNDYTGKTYQWYDHRSLANGGTGRMITNGATVDDINAHWWWRGDGQTPRGNTLTVLATMNTITSGIPSVAYVEPIHQCVVLDTTHQELVPLPTSYTVSTTNPFGGSAAQESRYLSRTTSGGFSASPATYLAQVIAGEQGYSTTSNYADLGGVIVDRPLLNYTIEFASGPAVGNSIGTHRATCNPGDADGRGWVDGTGDLSMFQTGTAADGTPLYGDINRVRVRTEGNVPWAGNVDAAAGGGAGRSYGASVMLALQVRVKDDPVAQISPQELIVYSSRASGIWDGTGQPPTPSCTHANVYDDPAKSGMSDGNTNIASGWCNLPFADDGADSTVTTDLFNEFDGRGVEWVDTNGRERRASADKIFIVEAALAINKSNTGGSAVQVANGNITEFAVKPKVVGSSLDEIDQVVVTDPLPNTMSFIGFTQNPTQGSCSHSGGSSAISPLDPTQTVTVGGTITCTYPDDLAGGWGNAGEGDFAFQVMIVGASANDTLDNTARIDGVDSFDPSITKQRKQSTASVFTGAPFDESVIVKAIDTGVGDCTEYPTAPIDAPSLDPQPADWAVRCERIVFENTPASLTSVMGFTLEMANQGNTTLTGVRFVDVFPHNGDEVEPISNTGADGVPVPTIGDGRSPETDTAGTVGLSSLSGDVQSYWVSGDDPNTISRDPDLSLLNTVWCNAPGGSPQTGVAGSCPATLDDVTAVYAFMDDIPIGGKITATLALESQNHECDDLWTNTFGARIAQLGLPIRSNDVSIMIDCDFDLALRKQLADAWAPGADWLTAGTSTVDFVIEVINQGDPINTFEVTDYVDPSMFVFDIADNPGGNSLDAAALPFTWDASGVNPVVVINDAAHPLHDSNSNLIINGDIIEIPVTLKVAPGYTIAGELSNKAEISYFDNDDDPTNGDSNSGLVDEDSLPDGADGDGLVDNEIDQNITAGDPDEDDHDIATLPVFDVELEKSNPVVTQLPSGDWQISYDITVLNNSNVSVYDVDVLETPPPGLVFASTQNTGGGIATTGGHNATITVSDPSYEVSWLRSGSSVTWTIVYDVTDVTAGPYVNSAQITDWAQLSSGSSTALAVDADSTENDDGDHAASNQDDDDIESANLPFDLALVKKPVVNDPAFPDIMNGVQDGDQILFEIEVFNQLTAVEDFDIIDYLNDGWIFDPSVQVSPQFTQPGSNGGPSLPYTWSSSGADPVAVVDGALPSGESVIISIVLTADIPNNPLAVLENHAEILRFDDDGDPSNGDSSDGTVVDWDSTPDGNNDDLLVDDEYNDDGTLDEDDHDIALTTWYDVSLEKRIADGAACVDGPVEITAATATVEYCLIVRNQGPATLYGVSLADTAPAGLSFSSTTQINAANVADNGGGSYTITSLAPGVSETVRVEYRVDVGAMTGASLTNVAEVTEMFADAGLTDPAEDVDSFVDDTPDTDTPVEDDESDQTITIPFDLALTKTLGEIDGDQVTMMLTLTNQSLAVEQVEITDYVDPAMWEPFTTALNAPGSVDIASTVTASYGYFWDTSDPANPVAVVTPNVAGDKIGFGETVVVPITLTIADGWTGPDLTNTAEISNFDDDGDDSNGDGADGTLDELDSTPDGDEGNGPGETFNSVDDDTSGDAAAGGDEDDHDGVSIPVYDLALVKTLDPATVQPVAPGDEITFFIEIFNQGNTHAADVTLIDYVDQTMFGPFNALIGDNNNGSSTTGDHALPYSWSATGTDGAVTVTGTIAPGNSVIVPVTLRVSFAPTSTVLDNTAEITGGMASDSGGTEITDGDGNSLTDLDSTADGNDDDTLVDDVTDNSGSDEDDHDIAEVVVSVPAIDIEKDTNGVQSDVAPGEQIAAGDPVTWSYEVTNTGTTALLDAVVTDSDPAVTVDCDPSSQVSATIPVLLPGDSVTCTSTGVAGVGAYANTADVSGTPAWPTDPSIDSSDPAAWPTDPADYTATGQADVTDTDDSHYYGTDGGLELEKSTNAIDADTAPGVPLAVGDAVTWTYEVTNTSPVAMLDVTVSDSDIGILIDCGSGSNVIDVLAPGATVTCTSSVPASAAAGEYHNDSEVTGTGALPADPLAPGVILDDPTTWPADPAAYDPISAPPFTDDDPSNYFALDGGLELEKSTNGVDSDVAPGEQILDGSIVTWTYAVTNNSSAVMIDVIVSDSDPAIAVDCGGGSDRIPVLAIGETVTCSATGTAVLGAYQNDSDVTGTPAMEDPDNPGGPSDDPSSYVSTGHGPSTDDDPSNYFGSDPSIDIEKSTNGDDADDTVGPFLAPGDAVAWTYVATNDGNVALTDVAVTDDDPAVTVDCGGSNVIALMLPGDSVTCTASGTATLGAYENTADVSGDPAELSDPAADPNDPASYTDSGLDPVTDDDPSHYIASDGDLVLEKSTNDEDADVVPGPIVNPGDPVTWTYAVTNTSATPLVDLIINDDQGEAVDCGDGGSSIAVLLPGETFECTATGIAGTGQYTNLGTVTGTPGIEDPANPGSYDPIPGADPVTDDDPSHYMGAVPSIDIEKATNGDDADMTVGPILAPGDAVTWTYVVTNDGDVPLVDATVTDSQGEVVDCGGSATIALLLPGDSVTCTASGTAALGTYENIADVSGTPAQLDDPAADPTDLANYSPTGQDDVDHDDPSHYVAHDGEVMLVKTTNGADANTAPGVVVNIGDPVTWTYTVVNGSDTPLVNLVVTDDQGELVDCGSGSNTITSLLPGAGHVCTATGIAGEGQYSNIGSVSGSPGQPDGNGGYEPIPGTDPVTDDDPSNYLGADPSIDIEKSTNSIDADDTSGPVLAPGDAVTWTYVVTNDGDVPLVDATVTDSQGEAVDCGGSATIALLLPGDSVTCTATGTAALGQYENIADVSGTPVQLDDPAADPTDPANYSPTGQDDVTDDDASHYVAHNGSVLLEKSTNTEDADVVPGPIVNPGDPVTWTYAVTNTSQTTLIDLIVTDDQGEAVDCGNGTNTISALAPGATHYCTATGTAGSGQYTNLGSVTGTPGMPDPVNGGFAPIPGADPVGDDDPSHYLGADPSIDIEKDTNGDDADDTSGPLLAPGDAVTWTYVVTNDGDVPLVDATVTDSQGEVVDCGGSATIALLLPGDSVTCTANGTAELGAYENIADVSGTPAQLDDPAADPTDPANYSPTGQDDVSDDDPSHYVAHDAAIEIEKSTNGEDADVVPGPILNPGDPVTWTYAVTNPSDTPVINAVVADDQGVTVDCGNGSNTIAVVLPGQTVTCTASGTAATGQYVNVGSVAGTPAIEDSDSPGTYDAIDGADPVADDDPSHHLGAPGSIDIEKATNGQDADTPFGPIVAPGDAITWTYEVTNDGAIPLSNVTVGDDDPTLSVDCGASTNTVDLLLPGASVTCTATGTAGIGSYANIGDVSATPVQPTNPADGCCDVDDPTSWPTDPAEFEPTGQDDVSDDDPSHYVANDGDIVLEKSTNNVDADVAPGPVLDTGSAVTWTYTVLNTSDTPLMDVTVTDDQGEAVDCGFGGSTIPVLMPGETHSCTATGTADSGQYTNLGSVTGQPAEEDPDNPGSFDPLPGVDPVTDDDPSNYLGADPSIDIEKDTNGDDADDDLGPILSPGDAITWTYVITNDGEVPLIDVAVSDNDSALTVDCAGSSVIALLMPNDSVTCTATGIADVGVYENIGAVSGTPAQLDDPSGDPTDPAAYVPTGQDDVADDDPSHYVGADGELRLEKSTNGMDADVAPGPIVDPASPVTWTYTVLNTSDTPLVNLSVTDDQGEFVDCGDGSNTIDVLLPGAMHQCTATGDAADGDYSNLGSVTGQPGAEDPNDPGSYLPVPDADPVTADDPSNHRGALPSIDIEKSTNGDDADADQGPVLAEGDVVTWTYVVTNDGDVPLVEATVTDNDPDVTVDCGGSSTIGLLLPGESVTCTATGAAELGSYENVAEVSGTPVQPTNPTDGCCDVDDPASWPVDPTSYEPTGQEDVADTDASHYVAIDSSVRIEKSTNGDDADAAPGPIVTPGSPIDWVYLVTNDGATPLINLVVADDQGVAVDCGDGTNAIDELLAGQMHICTGAGTAADGAYVNLGSVAGTPATAGPDGELVPVENADPVGDDDPSNHLGLEPSIDIEKTTNGDQADATSGPLLAIGDTVTWTYAAQNDGEVPLADVNVGDDDASITIDCGAGTNIIDLMLPGAIVVCSATGTAELGEYENVGMVSGTPVQPTDPTSDCCDPSDPASWPTDPAAFEATGQDPVTDEDLSHYVAHDGDLVLQKSTNGVDADAVPGPIVAPGDDVTWTYTVTNTSDTPLVNLTISDDQGEFVDCGDGGSSIAVLLPGETYRCTATGTATAGQYGNVGSVQGTPGQPDGDGGYEPISGADPVSAEDPSHYLGAVPSIDIEKSTNGEDSDTAPGEEILEGDPVTWTYVVTNDGDIAVVDAIVGDDDATLTIDCGDGTSTISLLAAGDSVTCTASGLAGQVDYVNTGSVEAKPAYEDPANPGSWLAVPNTDPVDDSDQSHYDAVPLAFDLALQKKIVSSGTYDSNRTFTIEVFNQGTVSATDVVIVDYPPGGMIIDDDDWTVNPDGTATTTIAGPIAPGESTIVTVDVFLNSWGTLENIAGIEGGSPVHPDSGAALDLADVDSSFGASNEDSRVDDVLNNSGGDEDDSDIASVVFSKPPVGTTVETGPEALPPGFFGNNSNNSNSGNTNSGNTNSNDAPERPTGPQAFADDRSGSPLAYTGANSGMLALLGALLVTTGAVFVLAGGKRRRKEGDEFELEWETLED